MTYCHGCRRYHDRYERCETEERLRSTRQASTVDDEVDAARERAHDERVAEDDRS